MDALIVYNCCGLSDKNNDEEYLHCLDTIRKQQGIRMKLVVSGCCLQETTKTTLLKEGYSCFFTDDIRSR
jgi:tRNA A37 methylthiotransferase MiaB